MSIAESSTLVTPEAVVLDYSIADLPSRILARLIDAIFLAFVVFSVLFVATLVAAALERVVGDGSDSLLLVVGFVAGFLLLFGYPAVAEKLWRGRTVGKSVLGLRVLSIDGAPVTFAQASLRSALQVVEIFFSGGGIAVVVSLFSQRGQRVGDHLAGTIVVREVRQREWLAEQAVVFPNPQGHDRDVAAIDPTPLGPQRMALVRSFLLRVQELDLDARFDLSERYAPRVAAVIGQPIPPNMLGETFLASVAAAQQRRTESSMNAPGWEVMPPSAAWPPPPPSPDARPSPTGPPPPPPPPGA